MTLENLKKEYAHLKWLASGEFTERDFDYKVKKSDNPEGDIKHQGEGGWSTMGEMKPQRKQLIMEDAVRRLENFKRKVIKVHPEFFSKPIDKPKGDKNAK